LASLDDGETMPGGVESSGKSPLEEESIGKMASSNVMGG